MLDPYRMVFVNLVVLSLVLIFLLIYKIKFPDKKINYFYLLIIFSILPVISIFRSGVYESGDMTIHIYHTIDFVNSLKDGTLIPRWGSSMNATYGHPVFIFMYIFPYYLISLLVLSGLTYIASFKIVLALSYIISGIFFFKWTEREFGKKGAFASTIFFLYAPYHLIDMHFRADIGEMVALALIPLCLYATKVWIDTNKPIFLLVNTVAVGMLITSHPALSIASIPLLIGYVFYYLSIKREISMLEFLNYIFSIILGIGITAIYWYVTISNLTFTFTQSFDFKLQFLKFQEIIYSPWRFGFLFQGPYGELRTIIGYAQVSIIIYGLYLLIKNKINKIKFIYFLLLTFLTIFMMIDWSKLLWKFIPFIDNFQFTYRLLGINIILTAFISGIILKNAKNKIYIFFITFAIISTILNWGNRGTLPGIDDRHLIQQLPYSTSAGAGVSQGILKWTKANNPWFDKISDKPIEILTGDAYAITLERKTNKHIYILNVKSNSIIKENTLFYPSWKLYINNTLYKFTHNEFGIIEFHLEPGLYLVVLEFSRSPGEKNAILISSVSLIILLVYFLLYFKMYNKKLLRPKR